MSSLRVTPDQLSAMSSAVARTSAAVRTDHANLRAGLSPLFGGEWSGAAATQFAALYEDFDRHARGMSDALDGIGRLLANAGLRYAEVEHAIAASFR